MMNVDQSPPAFPVSTIDGFINQGMTMREYFAANALGNQAICTGEAKEYDLKAWFGGRSGIRREEIVARQALIYADAVIKALEA